MEASEKCSEESEYLEEGGELVGVVMKEKGERKQNRQKKEGKERGGEREGREKKERKS